MELSVNCNVFGYIQFMIKSILHKGLKLLYEDNNASKLHPHLIDKIRRILTRLEFANSLEDINLPGARLHPLSGKLKGFFAYKVSGNWRIIFRYERGHIYDIDYIDYH